MTALLSQISVFFLFAAMAAYAAAFIAFTIDLAKRSSRVEVAADLAVPSAVARRTEAAELALENGGRTVTTTLARTSTRVEDDMHKEGKGSISLRIAFVLTILGFVLELVADVLRGVAADRVPWADMYEFSMTGTVVMLAIFLIMNIRYDLRFLGAFVTGFVVLLLGISTTRYYVNVVPLPPALQSYWLLIHVTVAILATGFLTIGFMLNCVQLVQARRERQIAEKQPAQFRFLATIPGSKTLENLAYRIIIIGFIFWTFTLIAGAIWAEKAWGAYWSWDTKEVWTFIVWVVYAGYIHARATRGWRGSRSAWLSIIGYTAVLFNFGIVNIFFHGLHSYSGL